MLERVVINLMGNAVKFTPEGGRVEVALTCDDHTAEIAVSDTGIGIPADEQERLFSRFFRSSLAQQQAIPGSGLGLSIAHAIVEKHGGAMAVESEPGRGTVFRSGSRCSPPPDAAMATIHRDAYGVPHVRAATVLDLAHGQAAPSRPTVQRSSACSATACCRAARARTGTADLARRAFARLRPETAAFVSAYVDGVNAVLDDPGSRGCRSRCTARTTCCSGT